MSQTVSVNGPGFSRIEWRILLGSLLMTPFFFVTIVLLTIGGAGSNLVPKLIVASAMSVFLGLVGFHLFPYPTRIDLGEDGIRVSTRLHTTRKSWEEVDDEVIPPMGFYRDGGGALVWRYRWPFRTSQPRNAGAWLTREQLRAVLEFPSGKAWRLPGEVARVVGS
ncbi:MAG: hypothetical protein ACHQ2Y_04295 [Candidatus Lutacidiplasmatales archaeon]